jgi:hypothetical protein
MPNENEGVTPVLMVNPGVPDTPPDAEPTEPVDESADLSTELGDTSTESTESTESGETPAPPAPDDDDYATLDTPEAVAEYLKSQGYDVKAPAAPGTESPSPASRGRVGEGVQSAPAPVDTKAQEDAIIQKHAERYANSFDDGERFRINVECQQELQALRYGAIEKQTARTEAMSRLPQVERDFEANGLPKEAAAHYIDLLVNLDPAVRATPEAQAAALSMAVGRATMQKAKKPGPQPQKVRVPKGEGTAPAGGARPTGGVDARELAVLKRTFPDVDFTPAKIAEFKKEGLL